MKALDQLFTIFYRKLLDALCYVTGKSNFYFAKVAYIATIFFCATYTVIAQDWLTGCITTLWTIMLPAEFRRINEVERQTNQHSDVMTLSSIDRERWIVLRVLAVVFGLVELSLAIIQSPRILKCAFMLSLAASEYFRYENNSGGKHILRRAFDWAMAHKPNFNLAPAPRPEIA